MKAFKFRVVKPSKQITAKFESWLAICCELYNAGLQERRDAWRIEHKTVSCYQQQAKLAFAVRELKKLLLTAGIIASTADCPNIEMLFRQK